MPASLAGSPIAASIGWALVHSLWEGAIISAILGALLLVLRKPGERYLAACAAMFVMLAAFIVTLSLLLPESSHTLTRTALTFPAWNSLPNKYASSPLRLNLSAAVPWLAPFWIVGVLLIYMRHFMACWTAQKFRRRGICCAAESWQAEIARLTALLRIFRPNQRPIQLMESSLADVPMVLGHFRPLILMPVGLLAGLSAAQVEMILLHELAHIRRHDYLVNTLQRFVEGLFFYHPAIWWISRVIRSERESCCDDLAVSIGGNAHEYAQVLASLEQNRLSAREAVIAASGGNLMKRIRRLLYPQTKSNSGWAPFLAATILIVTAIVTAAAWPSKSVSANLRARQSATPAELGSASSPALKPVYEKWLNEDVVYIIDGAERSAFLDLKTDEERNKFVEQFWARRNPTPGTADNAFKQEHYQRLAYANQHFAAGTPGWRTDRGHVYIVYGKPDELEAYPHGPGSTEIWTYRHIQGIGDNATIAFIDSTGNGDYRLAPAVPIEKQK